MPSGFRVGRHAPVALLFVLLTVVHAFPLVAYIDSRIPGWEGDNVYYVRSIWWIKRAFLDLGVSPFLDITSYVPVGHHIARSEMTSSNTIPVLPVTVIWGPVVAYNVVLLFSFAATGFFTYLWVERFSASRAAGVIAGIVTAFLPMRYAHLVGHLPQVTTHWLPLTLYAFELFRERPTLRRAAFMGAAAALFVLGCWYYGYALAVLFPVYVLLRTPRPMWRTREYWIGVTASAAVATALVLPFLIPMLRLVGAGDIRRTLTEMDSWSLNPYDFVIPNLLHPIIGEYFSTLFPIQRALWVERGITLGIVAAAVALVGFVANRRRTGVTALATLWVLSFLIALGPTLHWQNQQVRVPMPGRVVAGVAKMVGVFGNKADDVRASLMSSQAVPIPLPSFFMYFVVPMTSGMRVMARFALWTGLMTAALAGLGVLVLMNAAGRRWGPAAGGAVGTAVAAAILFETLTVVPMMPVGPRAVDTWLATQPDDVVIAEMPLEQDLRSLQNYWATEHGRRRFFGWSGDSYPPPIQVRRAANVKDFPSPTSIGYLKDAGVTYVLVTPSQVPSWDTMKANISQFPEIQHDRTVGDVEVYRLVR